MIRYEIQIEEADEQTTLRLSTVSSAPTPAEEDVAHRVGPLLVGAVKGCEKPAPADAEIVVPSRKLSLPRRFLDQGGE